ncbi:MAG: hypothetical protein Tsb0015_02810 [Simkaniaceae bacterium]
MKYFILVSFLLLFLPLSGNEISSSTSSSSSLDCLKGIEDFVVIFETPSKDLQQKIFCVIKEDLQKIGTVEEKKIPDMSGFGATGKLVINIHNIIPDQESPDPILQACLNLYTSITVARSKISCFTSIWVSEGFAKGWLNNSNSSNVIKSVREAVSQFLIAYKTMNQSKPIFYLYQ